MSDGQYLLAEETTTAELVEALAQHLEVADAGSHRCDRIYYDTFDALARDAGLSVAHEAGTPQLIDRESGDDPAVGAPQTVRRSTLVPAELDPGPRPRRPARRWPRIARCSRWSACAAASER